MPIAKVAADIELIGVCIDQNLVKDLNLNIIKILEEIDAKIDVELSQLSGKIAEWRLSPELILSKEFISQRKLK